MRFKYENLKNSALLYIAFCAFALLGTPLYCGANFIMNYSKNVSLENLSGYDKDGNFHVEKWEAVPNYEGRYEGSTFGRIKSLAREANKCRVDRMLKQTPNRNGYYMVSFQKEGRHKSFSVHRIVARLFIPNPHNLPEVNHRDLKKTNNCVWNLEWMTSRGNSEHYTQTIKTSSQYTGVYFHKKSAKWAAYIHYNNKVFHLGLFEVEIEAHHAYQKALKEINEGIFAPTIKGKSSAYKGVFWNKRTKNWRAYIGSGDKRIYIGGGFCTELEAYEAQQAKIKELSC